MTPLRNDMYGTKNAPMPPERFTLVVTEWESKARHFAGILSAYKRKEGFFEGNGYRIIWTMGPMTELALPEVYDSKYKKWILDDLPMFPEKWKMVTTPGKLTQAGILIGQMNADDVDLIINACNSDREGEMVFRSIYDQAGAILPVKRLWIHSMEEEAVKEGMETLQPLERFDDLATAAQYRARVDYLVGVNCTRAWSAFYGKKIIVGRTRTPILALICRREQEMKDFHPSESWTVQIDTGEGVKLETEAYADEKELVQIMEECRKNSIRITKVEETEECLPAPPLYNRITLLRDANRIFGFSVKETAHILKELYNDKLITNPNSEETKVPTDMEMHIRKLVELACEYEGVDGFQSDAQIYHILEPDMTENDALPILPTEQVTKPIVRDREEDEQKILHLILFRLLESACMDHVRTRKDISAVCGSQCVHMVCYTTKSQGYMNVRNQFYDRFLPQRFECDLENSDNSINAEITEGKTFAVKDTHPVLYRSVGPEHYSEDTLLEEIARIGLSETVIERLVAEGSVRKEEQWLIPTELGVTENNLAPEQLKDLKLASYWEAALRQLEIGQCNVEAFMEEIQEMIMQMIDELRERPQPERSEWEYIGSCPVCGTPVKEGHKNFYCTNRDCQFVIWKNNNLLNAIGKPMNEHIAEELLREGNVFLENCRSRRTGKLFNATLHMELNEEGKAQYNLSFPERSED